MQPIHLSLLPPFSNQRGCAKCGARREIWVKFDRDCSEVSGAHFHRICNCGHRWVEQARYRESGTV